LLAIWCDVSVGLSQQRDQERDRPVTKNDLKEILTATQPEVVYTHNLADKHDTHIGVVIAALQAMRELPREQRPKKVIGCESGATLTG